MWVFERLYFVRHQPVDRLDLEGLVLLVPLDDDGAVAFGELVVLGADDVEQQAGAAVSDGGGAEAAVDLAAGDGADVADDVAAARGPGGLEDLGERLEGERGDEEREKEAAQQHGAAAEQAAAGPAADEHRPEPGEEDDRAEGDGDGD